MARSFFAQSGQFPMLYLSPYPAATSSDGGMVDVTIVDQDDLASSGFPNLRGFDQIESSQGDLKGNVSAIHRVSTLPYFRIGRIRSVYAWMKSGFIHG